MASLQTYIHIYGEQGSEWAAAWMMYYLLIGCVWQKSLAHEKAKQTKQKK